jgi:hypothetical protein
MLRGNHAGLGEGASPDQNIYTFHKAGGLGTRDLPGLPVTVLFSRLALLAAQETELTFHFLSASFTMPLSIARAGATWYKIQSLGDANKEAGQGLRILLPIERAFGLRAAQYLIDRRLLLAEEFSDLAADIIAGPGFSSL